jgi:peptide deformylase
MYAYDGVGLAAPQVAKNIRVIATTQWKETKK